jgi:hypothetical protein
MRRITLAVMAILALFVGSCQKAPHPVIGKWYTPTGGTMEFQADGKLILAESAGTVEGAYRLIDDKTFEMVKPDSQPSLVKIESVTPDELVINTGVGPKRLFKVK